MAFVKHVFPLPVSPTIATNSPFLISTSRLFNNILGVFNSLLNIPKLQLYSLISIFLPFKSWSSLLVFLKSFVFKNCSNLFIDIKQFNNVVINIGSLYKEAAIVSKISRLANRFSKTILPLIKV